MGYLTRGIEDVVRQRIRNDRLTIIEGARATGKTALAEHLVAEGTLSTVLSFADDDVLQAARQAPRDFVAGLRPGTVLDEVQLFEEITLPIKAAIDRNSSPGQFVLTGSSRLRRNALGGSDPFAGRTRRPLTLWPMTIGERRGRPVQIIETLFDGQPSDLPLGPPLGRRDLIDLVTQIGLPSMLEAQSDDEPSSASERVVAYLTSITSLKTFESRNVRGVQSLARFIASRTSTLVNLSDFGRKTEIDRSTVAEYLALLTEALVVRELPQWRDTQAKIEQGRSKLHFFDPGMAARLGRLKPANSDQDLGNLVESFAVAELTTQAEWTNQRSHAFHWRSKNHEVDLVLERPDGHLLCIEVKTSEAARPSDFRGIDAFRRAHPDREARGIVLCAGEHVLPFGDDRWAVPFRVLVPATVDSHAEGDSDPADRLVSHVRNRLRQHHESEAIERRLSWLVGEVTRQLQRVASELAPVQASVVGQRTRTRPAAYELTLSTDAHRAGNLVVSITIDGDQEYLAARVADRASPPTPTATSPTMAKSLGHFQPSDITDLLEPAVAALIDQL